MPSPIPPHVPPGRYPRPVRARLESWKEIASYLDRSVRTVQRWEKTEGLPVRRLFHDRPGVVHAYTKEIDAWWKDRSARLSSEVEIPAATAARRWRRWLAAAAMLAGVCAAVFLWLRLAS